jgi:hypothetical protein
MFSNFIQKKDFSEKIIFIVGVPRSGTTWLWGILTSFEKIEPLVREDFEPENPSVVGKQRITSETGAFIKHSDRKILRVVKEKFKKHPQKILLEKTPYHIFHIERIFRLFPKAKIIYIKRDPRAVISSMLHSRFFKFADSLEDAIEKYKACLLTIEPYLKNKNVLTVKYEDLYLHPRETIIGIMKFVKFSASENEIFFALKDNEKKSKVSLPEVFRKGVINSYKEDLSAEEIRKIEKELLETV